MPSGRAFFFAVSHPAKAKMLTLPHQKFLKMNIENIIYSALSEALKELYNIDLSNLEIQLQKTRKDFEGDITLVVFPFLRYSKKSPGETANEIGNYIVSKIQEVDSFNVINGFLNLVICDDLDQHVIKSC